MKRQGAREGDVVIGVIDHVQFLGAVLEPFGPPRPLPRLFLIDAPGAGREFNDKLFEMHRAFASLITRYLDEGVRQDALPPLNTGLAGTIWFGALNELVVCWLLDEDAAPLATVYPELRAIFRRSIGLPLDEEATA